MHEMPKITLQKQGIRNYPKLLSRQAGKNWLKNPSSASWHSNNDWISLFLPSMAIKLQLKCKQYLCTNSDQFFNFSTVNLIWFVVFYPASCFFYSSWFQKFLMNWLLHLCFVKSLIILFQYGGCVMRISLLFPNDQCNRGVRVI